MEDQQSNKNEDVEGQDEQQANVEEKQNNNDQQLNETVQSNEVQEKQRSSKKRSLQQLQQTEQESNEVEDSTKQVLVKRFKVESQHQQDDVKQIQTTFPNQKSNQNKDQTQNLAKTNIPSNANHTDQIESQSEGDAVNNSGSRDLKCDEKMDKGNLSNVSNPELKLDEHGNATMEKFANIHINSEKQLINNKNYKQKMISQKKAQANSNEVNSIQDEDDPEVPTRDKDNKNEKVPASNKAYSPKKKQEKENNEVPQSSGTEEGTSSQGTNDMPRDYKFEVIELETHEPLQSTFEEGEQVNIVQLFYPQKCKIGRRIGNRFHCHQQIYRRAHSDGNVSLIWALHNIGPDDFLNKPETNIPHHYVESGIFETIDGLKWKLRLEPGLYPVKVMTTNQQGHQQTQISNKSSKSKISLVAIPTEKERQKCKVNRRIEIKYSTFLLNGDLHSQKDWYREFDFRNDSGEEATIEYDSFCHFPQPRNMKSNFLSDQFLIQIEILNLVPRDAPAQSEPEGSVSGDEKKKDKEEGQNLYQYKGMMNEGTTCYLNSVIQSLFFIRPFRNAVYKMPTITMESDLKKLESSIPFCLQRIFYNLQLGNSSFVRTHELLQAFGWNSNDINQQQDVNEFNCILSEKLDKQMENTPVRGTFNRLFEGELQNVIKCINQDYESNRDEKFNTIQLIVRGNQTIEESVKEYISEEKLDGKNQYQTEKYGKQDALKFIRFKNLPPVLQISLNRYEFDVNFGNMVKSNQKFEFKEILDLEQILKKDQDGKKEQEEKIENKYHLHSILVHRGTINAGHYYAFIKPTMEDKWYEFNDSKVQEVTKDYAFGQGIGGNLTQFEFLRQSPYKESTGQLIERHKENFANAYMLIYVREQDRQIIMSDKLSIDEQIPQELQMHFKIEEMYKDQIHQDYEYYQEYGKLQMLSAETLEFANWDGPSICQKFKDERQPPKYRFEMDQKQHLGLFVSKYISVNEFIIMIKNRFFKNDDNVELEDIWLYRVQNVKNQKSNYHFFYVLNKIIYSIGERYDCPLFSVRPSHDTADWNQEQKSSTKWKKNLLMPSIVRLLVINPLKLNPRTNKPYNVLQRLSESDIEGQKQHYNQFIEYIKKTDMMQGNYYLNMYNNFNEQVYRFTDNNQESQQPTKDVDGSTDKADIESKPQTEGGLKDVSFQQQVSENINQIEQQRKQIKHFRDKFVFEVDKALQTQQLNEYNAFLEKQDTPDQIKDTKKSKQPNLYLSFVKVAYPVETKIQQKGILFFDIEKPLDISALQKKAGISNEQMQQYEIFVEPYSNSMLRSYFDMEKRAGQFKTENYAERGLIQFRRTQLDLYRVDTKIIKGIPLKEILKYNSEGLCFTFFPKTIMKINDHGQEQMVKLDETQQFQHYYTLLTSLVNRGYVKLCYLSDSDITKCQMTETQLGYWQFNYLETFDQILNRIANVGNNSGLDVLVSSQQQLSQHIQIFDDEIKVVSYGDYSHLNIYADANKSSLENLVTDAFFLNFTVHQIPFSRIDSQAEVRYIPFQSDEVVPTSKQPCCSTKVSRDSSVTEFSQQFQKENKLQGVYLVMEIDRETGTIIKILKENTHITQIVGNRKQLSLSNVPKILRLNEVKSDDVIRINDIIQESGSPNCCFAFIWIYDQYKKKREQYKQFIIPFNKQKDTFNDIIENTKQKLELLKRKDTNNLEQMDIGSLRMWTVKYNNKFVIQKQRVYYLDDFDWRNPMLQYEINDQVQPIGVFNLLAEFVNNNNEMYQPYSTNANKNGSVWFSFVYMAAMVTFSDPPDKDSTVTKRPSNAGGFVINSQNEGDKSKDSKSKN